MNSGPCIIALLTLAAVGPLGCGQALFPSDMPRTQYDRYDRLRGRYVPAEHRTAQGEVEPALRERLTPNRP